MGIRYSGIEPSTGFDYDAERVDRMVEEIQEDGETCDTVIRELLDNGHGDCITPLMIYNTKDGIRDAAAKLGELAKPIWLRLAREKITRDDDSAAERRAEDLAEEDGRGW